MTIKNGDAKLNKPQAHIFNYWQLNWIASYYRYC